MALAHFLFSQTIPTISSHATQEDSAFGRAAERREGTHLSALAAGSAAHGAAREIEELVSYPGDSCL